MTFLNGLLHTLHQCCLTNKNLILSALWVDWEPPKEFSKSNWRLLPVVRKSSESMLLHTLMMEDLSNLTQGHFNVQATHKSRLIHGYHKNMLDSISISHVGMPQAPNDKLRHARLVEPGGKAPWDQVRHLISHLDDDNMLGTQWGIKNFMKWVNSLKKKNLVTSD